jgi:hypothetical protein
MSNTIPRCSKKGGWGSVPETEEEIYYREQCRTVCQDNDNLIGEIRNLRTDCQRDYRNFCLLSQRMEQNERSLRGIAERNLHEVTMRLDSLVATRLIVGAHGGREASKSPDSAYSDTWRYYVGTQSRCMSDQRSQTEMWPLLSDMGSHEVGKPGMLSICSCNLD